MTRQFLSAALTLATLTACAPPPPPSVTAFNGDSVELLSVGDQIFPNAQTNGEADRICSKAGKYAEYASSRPVNEGQMHLYLCLSPIAQPVQQAAISPYQPITPAQPILVIK